jgi:hypothetical protein
VVKKNLSVVGFKEVELRRIDEWRKMRVAFINGLKEWIEFVFFISNSELIMMNLV